MEGTPSGSGSLEVRQLLRNIRDCLGIDEAESSQDRAASATPKGAASLPECARRGNAEQRAPGTSGQTHSGIPVNVPGQDFSIPDLNPHIARIGSAVQQMAGEAARIGTIPQNYPVHADLVMKAIHRLLPWYTRPIAGFGARATDAVRELADAVTLLAQFDHAVMTRLIAIERNLKGIAAEPAGMPPSELDDTQPSEPNGRLDVAQLLRNICRRLEVPMQEKAAASGHSTNLVAASRVGARVGATVQEMANEAAKIGTVPGNYGLHLKLLMKSIRALLPWYTRPIANFGIRGTDAVRELADAISSLGRAQSEILARLSAVERQIKATGTDHPSQSEVTHEDPYPAERSRLR